MAHKGTVYVGLSGGVDSGVSAALLKEAGYDVVGVFITIALPGYPCPAAADRRDAMRVAAHLKIPFKNIDLSKEYKQLVFDSALRDFARGQTPNPDTLCNREIKFGAFYNFAIKDGADFVATGHYAQVGRNKSYSSTFVEPLTVLAEDADSRYGIFSAKKMPEVLVSSHSQPPTSASPASLLVSEDSEKDQSYFLWMVPEEHLRRVLFPIGHLKKPQVRELAKKFDLPNAARPDSQGLCFLGDVSLTDMLEQELKPVPGNVLSIDGTIVGKHRGAMLYTLGERHGFELFAHTPHTQPHFIVAKDAIQNTITVSTERASKDAAKTHLSLREANWIGDAPDGAYMARFRYRQKLMSATLTKTDSGATVVLAEPQVVPPGQSLVLYQGNRCLGGGVIDTVY